MRRDDKTCGVNGRFREALRSEQLLKDFAKRMVEEGILWLEHEDLLNSILRPDTTKGLHADNYDAFRQYLKEYQNSMGEFLAERNPQYVGFIPSLGYKTPIHEGISRGVAFLKKKVEEGVITDKHMQEFLTAFNRGMISCRTTAEKHQFEHEPILHFGQIDGHINWVPIRSGVREMGECLMKLDRHLNNDFNIKYADSRYIS